LKDGKCFPERLGRKLDRNYSHILRLFSGGSERGKRNQQCAQKGKEICQLIKSFQSMAFFVVIVRVEDPELEALLFKVVFK
jgi:hypothetical protein